MAENGTLYTGKILDRADLDRQIVRSSSCEITIPELDLTLPPTERGQLTTVEGLIRDIVTDLSLDQPLRKIQAPEAYEKIQVLINKMKAILGDPEDDDDEAFKDAVPAAQRDTTLPPFTLKLNDPSGNSFLEFLGSMSDPKWHLRTYPRTFEQNVQLGLVAADDADAAKEEVPSGEISKEEVLVFPGKCSSCGHGLQTLMKRVDIPYFKVCELYQTLVGSFSFFTLGNSHHVYELRALWIQRQRSQVRLGYLTPRQEDPSYSRRCGRYESRYSEGMFPFLPRFRSSS